MSYVILAFAIIMLVTGIVILIKPMVAFRLVNNYSQSLGLHVFAVAIRLFLGAVLILFAKSTEFPLTLEVLGWLLIAAGIILTVIGRKNFKRLVTWAVDLIPQYGRIIGIFAILISGLLGYVAV